MISLKRLLLAYRKNQLEEAKRRAAELENDVVKAILADEVIARASTLLKSMNAS
ncbi:MAG: hypothetical protein ABJE79_14315 [Marinomonas sp.]